MHLLGFINNSYHDEYLGYFLTNNNSHEGKEYFTFTSLKKYFSPIDRRIFVSIRNTDNRISGAQKEVYKHFEKNYTKVMEQANSFMQRHHQEEAKRFSIDDVGKKLELNSISIDEADNNIYSCLVYTSKTNEKLLMGLNFIKLEIESIKFTDKSEL
jgi:hypothetical protein